MSSDSGPGRKVAFITRPRGAAYVHVGAHSDSGLNMVLTGEVLEFHGFMTSAARHVPRAHAVSGCWRRRRVCMVGRGNQARRTNEWPERVDPFPGTTSQVPFWGSGGRRHIWQSHGVWESNSQEP